MLEKFSVSTQQIYCVVLEIKGSLAMADPRWTFFQAPLVVEDALGFKFPVPSEYDYELLNAIIQHRFLEGPGSLEVKAGNYELLNIKDRKQVLSTTTRTLPGSTIMMAILVSKPVLTHDICPMRRCRSKEIIQAPGGGRIWWVFFAVLKRLTQR